MESVCRLRIILGFSRARAGLLSGLEIKPGDRERLRAIGRTKEDTHEAPPTQRRAADISQHNGSPDDEPPVSTVSNGERREKFGPTGWHGQQATNAIARLVLCRRRTALWTSAKGRLLTVSDQRRLRPRRKTTDSARRFWRSG